MCIAYKKKNVIVMALVITKSVLRVNTLFLFPSVKKIQVIKGLTETKARETETVTLEVELSQVNVEGSWNRDRVKLKSGPNCHITALGKKHILTLSSLKQEDAGMISFQAEGVHTSAKLIVTGNGGLMFVLMRSRFPKKIQSKKSLMC